MLMEYHNKNDTTHITGIFVVTNVRSINNESGDIDLILAKDAMIMRMSY
jgi:predicted TIM-barrel enzyme